MSWNTLLFKAVRALPCIFGTTCIVHESLLSLSVDIVVVVVVGGCCICRWALHMSLLSLLSLSVNVVVLLLLDELNMLLSMIYIKILRYFVEFRVLDSIDEL